jgi:hypothetical protein
MSVDVLERPSATRGPLLTERRWVALVCGIAYLAVAAWFWHYHLMPGDASSRLANAYYTIYSRDPHLAAIGFVWNPLPSLLLLPFLPLKLLVPGLTQSSGLAVLASAVLMTGVVVLVRDVLADMGLNRTLRLLLTTAFALHPMTVLYAGNGMSEACFLICLMLAVRGLERWLRDGRAESLVPLGLALALCYGARYEALAPAAAVPALVALVTWFRAGGTRERRRAVARADAVLVGLPALLAVILWALASRIIVGEWFATFSSQYGNSAQVSTSAASISSVTGADLPARLAYLWHQMFGLAPFWIVLLVAALAVAWRRRDPAVLGPIAVLGSVTVFDTGVFLTGTSFGWLRFQIALVPLAVLLAGHVLAGPRSPARPQSTRHDGVRGLARAPQRVAAVATLFLVFAAFPAMVPTLRNSNLSREESQWVTASGRAHTEELSRINHQVADDLDAMNLPAGSVITDVAYAFGIVLASDRPHQFVITPDRDFQAALGDPAGHHVRYLLLSGDGPADAVRLARYGPDRRAVPGAGVVVWRDVAGDIQWTLVPA